ncbi:hypothetical protein NOF04DRAFT_1307988 [Fusarium oxysporum II5]|nr:hypothetical protein NOF04DRAFT_1307988 [Fusarium oxysporum II5]
MPRVFSCILGSVFTLFRILHSFHLSSPTSLNSCIVGHKRETVGNQDPVFAPLGKKVAAARRNLTRRIRFVVLFGPPLGSYGSDGLRYRIPNN